MSGVLDAICRVGQNRIYTPYMTVYMVISLPNIPYTHRIYVVLANPSYLFWLGWSTIARLAKYWWTLRLLFAQKILQKCLPKAKIHRVGQNHIYTVYIWYFWQGIHQIHGHIRCIYTVLANPKNTARVPATKKNTAGVPATRVPATKSSAGRLTPACVRMLSYAVCALIIWKRVLGCCPTLSVHWSFERLAARRPTAYISIAWCVHQRAWKCAVLRSLF
jgi:hypothetical protein